MRQEINFYALMKRQSRWAAWLDPARLTTLYAGFLGLLLIVFLKNAIFAGIEGHRLTVTEQERAAVHAELAVLQGQTSGENMQEALQKLGATAGAPGSPLAVTAESFPDVLQAFAEVDVPGVWLTGFSLSNAGAEISLTGAALNPTTVQTYLEQLSRQTIFQKMSFQLGEIRRVAADNTAATTWMSFQMTGKAVSE